MDSQYTLKQKLSQPESIPIIKQILIDHDHLSRTRIAAAVCKHFKFYDAQGKPQQGNCLKALRDLETVHGFALPDGRHKGQRRRSIKRLDHPVEEPVDVPAKAGDVCGLHLVRVTSDRETRIWNEMMSREHPREAGIMVGAQLRYLIGSSHGWLGGFGFGASALNLKDRDQWIGWDAATKQQHRFRVVNMSRFLIRPSVRCRNLASLCMGKALRQVAVDFESLYGYCPWLVESFIDTEQHTGVCYEASNWIKVGVTQGRGRNDVHSKKQESIKAIYLYPLTKNFRKHMGVDEPEPPKKLDIGDGMDQDVWAQNEFGGAKLGDARLSKRLVEMASIQAANPMRSFCGAAAGERSVVKGYYRMIEQPDDSAVSMAAILAPHRDRTIQRMRGQKKVLCIQDGTDINYNSLAQCEGLGVIGKNQTDASSKGLHMHSTFVVDTDAGIPLGVLDVECTARQLKTGDSSPEDKKTHSWLHATRNNNKLAKLLPDTHQIVTMDREADFFELFEDPRHSRVDLLVRAKHNRKTDGDLKLFDSIRKSLVQGQLSITVPRQSARPKLSKQKARPKRKKRQAVVDLRYQPIQMRAPGTKEHKDKEPIHLWMVHIREVSPPLNEKGVEWFLLATWPITSNEEAQECVRWYSLRWRIEDFHRVLKSGCKIEELAYKTAERLKRGIAINIVIAWRIMLMTLLGRECPELPAEVLFSDLEIKVLEAYAVKKKELPLTLGNGCQIIASMGGHLGRKHDLPPGHQVMWNGYYCLQKMCEGFALAEYYGRTTCG